MSNSDTGGLKSFYVTVPGHSNLPGPLSVAKKMHADDVGVHFYDEHNELTAFFPRGHTVVSADAQRALKSVESVAGEMVAGELATFDLPARVEVGTINITLSAGAVPESIGEAVAGLMSSRDAAASR